MIQNIEKIENLLNIGKYEKMYRINYKGMRLYISETPFKYYSGLTGALSASTFNGDQDNKRLQKWRDSMIGSFGEKNMRDYIDFTADFGTLLHMSLLTIKERGKLVWGEEKDHAEQYFISAYKVKKLEPDMGIVSQMVYEYQKHAASLLQFVYERVHEIYAIETPAKCDELNIATPIDLVCSCRQIPKGGHEKTVINLKTSNQITNHHMEQVSMELYLWNKNYDHAANAAILRTKDWRDDKSPTFDYKYLKFDEAMENKMETVNRLLLCLNSKASYYPKFDARYFSGETKIGEKPLIISKTIQEEWEEQKLKGIKS